jgi:predicted nuclease of predicted toxin-antitoxin system
MRFLTDENFNNHIFRGLLLQKPGMDIVRVQDVGLSGKDDPEVLAWALSENRILLTHDAKTIPAFAFTRLSVDLTMKFSYRMTKKAA